MTIEEPKFALALKEGAVALRDDAVTVALRVLPTARLAGLRFSGLTGEAKVEAARLMGFVPVGPSSIACYDPPWTPWFLHCNEVMLPVATVD